MRDDLEAGEWTIYKACQAIRRVTWALWHVKVSDAVSSRSGSKPKPRQANLTRLLPSHVTAVFRTLDATVAPRPSRLGPNENIPNEPL